MQAAHLPVVFDNPPTGHRWAVKWGPLPGVDLLDETSLRQAFEHIRAAFDPAVSPVSVFNDDYNTRDGTCIRDYIRVEDLCTAHLQAMEYLARHDGAHVFNLGTGCGSSVEEVLTGCRALHGGEPAAAVAARRPGDPARQVANADEARAELGREPQQTLATAIEHASACHAFPN